MLIVNMYTVWERGQLEGHYEEFNKGQKLLTDLIEGMVPEGQLRDGLLAKAEQVQLLAATVWAGVEENTWFYPDAEFELSVALPNSQAEVYNYTKNRLSDEGLWVPEQDGKKK